MKEHLSRCGSNCEVFEVVKEAWVSFQNQTVYVSERVCMTTSRHIAVQILHKKSDCRLITHRTASTPVPIPLQNLYISF